MVDSHLTVRPWAIFIEKSKEEAKTDSGIIISSDSDLSANCIAKITHVGKMAAEEYGLAVGDKVVFNPYSGVPIRLGRQDLVVITVDDCFGTIVEDSKE